MFQSHAGSIEAFLDAMELKNRFLSFNPTLVRLRPVGVGVGVVVVEKFQSHAGSIEAAPRGLNHTLQKAVSIPRWFD